MEQHAGPAMEYGHDAQFFTSGRRIVKKTGTFHGKSNKLGHGGRAAQLKAEGVPGGVIGELARKAQAAPGQKNYHPSKKRGK